MSDVTDANNHCQMLKL